MPILYKTVLRSTATALAFSTPIGLFAGGAEKLTNPPENVTALINDIGRVIVNPIIYMLFTAAFVVFIWGLVQFVMHLDNEEARITGGKHMLYGLIGMAIMAGVGGIVTIIQNTIASIGG